MKKWESTLLTVSLALLASPAFAMPQGAPSSEQGVPPDSLTAPQLQGPGQRRGLYRRRLHRRRAHRRHWRHARRHRRGMAMMWRNPALQQRLGITPEQAAKIQTQESEFGKATIRNRAEIQLKRQELRELLATENPDRALAEKKLRELGEAQFAGRRAMLENRLALAQILTPEQRTKMRQMFWERRNFGRPTPPAPGGPPNG